MSTSIDLLSHVGLCLNNPLSNLSGLPKKLSCRHKLMKRTAVKVAKKRPIDFNRGAIIAAKRQRIFKTEKTEAGEMAQAGKPLELDEKTTQILEEELQAIMIKVWQSLPDSPPLPAERYVAERLRNEASDDIRNVLGLNVTKRLLNVFNPLFIRVQFLNRIPDSTSLKRFIKTYNIKEFRQHKLHRNLYVGRVHDIADFDRLCVANTVRCGDSIVTVKPSYRFSQCPMKLNTVFIKKIKTASTSKETENPADVEKEVADKENSEAASKDKVVKQATRNSETERKSVESKHDQPPKTNVEKKYESDKNKVTAQNQMKANAAKTHLSNPKEVEQSYKNIKADIAKKNNVTPNEVSDPKPNVHSKGIDVKKATPQSNLTEPTTVKKDTTPTNKPKQQNHEIATKKVTEPTPKSTENPTATTNIKHKPVQVSKEVVATKILADSIPKSAEKLTATSNIIPKPKQVSQDVVATKKVIEPTPKSAEKFTPATDIKPKPNQNNQKVMATKKHELMPVKKEAKHNVTKPKPKQVNKEIAATKKVTDATPKFTVKDDDSINSEHFDDTDEMNDEEILALISTGVIVDECSGSDEE